MPVNSNANISKKLLLLGVIFWGLDAQALNCDSAAEDVVKAQSSNDDSLRLLRVQGLHNDVLSLRSISDSYQGKPRSYWQNCLNTKVKALNMEIDLSSPKLRSNPDFQVLIASNFEMRGEFGKAFFHANEATKILVKDNNLRLKTFLLWLKSQNTLLDLEGEVAKKGRALGLGNKTDFDRQVESFLFPIMKERSSSPADLISAYRSRAAYYEALARIVDAASDWEKLAELDPMNVTYYKKIAAFELIRGRRTQAQTLLEKVTSKVPSDLGAQKKLIEIYIDKREIKRAQTALGQALSFYPGDADLLAFAKSIQ